MRRLLWILAIVICCGCVAAACATELPIPEGQTLIEPAYPVPEYVEQLLDMARGELGYKEERNGNTKYGVWAGDPAAEWCAEFVCWCVNQVDIKYGSKLLTVVYPKYFSSNIGRDWFIEHGRYVARKGIIPNVGTQWYKGESEPMARNSYIPQPGDWVFFSVSNTGDTTHVAMVEFCTVDAAGKVTVHVIEGNNPDSVARNTYPLDYWALLGYGTVYDVADFTLKVGSSGEKVKALQEKLVKAGLLDSQYITGKYAYITKGVITDFQKAQKLTQNGVANQETQLALDAYILEYYRTHADLWSVEDD